MHRYQEEGFTLPWIRHFTSLRNKWGRHIRDSNNKAVEVNPELRNRLMDMEMIYDTGVYKLEEAFCLLGDYGKISYYVAKNKIEFLSHNIYK